MLLDQAAALALKVEHLVWGIEAMSSGLSMGQLDTLKAFLLDQAARVDEAKVRNTERVPRTISISKQPRTVLECLRRYSAILTERERES